MFLCTCIQMGRNLFSVQQPEVSSEVNSLPGSDSPAAQQSSARTAFVHLQGLASSPRIPLSHSNHREAWNRGRKLSSWSLPCNASSCVAAHTVVLPFPSSREFLSPCSARV